jgi:hypothetical protein
MPSEPLHAAFDVLRARLQAELEAQLTSLQNTIEERHQEALAEARRATAADVQERWSARLDALRTEWASRLRGELATASAESDRTLRAEIVRLQSEKASAVAAVTGSQRPEHRDLSRAALNRLAGTLRAISDAPSLTSALDALADGAAAEAPRTALFVLTGPAAEARNLTATDFESNAFERWRSTGFDDSETPQVEMPATGVLAHAIRTRQPTVTRPAGASVQSDQQGLVVPLVVGEQTVALLYAEGEANGDTAGIWPDAVQMVAQHASTCLSHLTALRISQALGAGRPVSETVGAAAGAARDEDGSARRYARLLVSEIKLYNELAVRTGRERRDLLARLRPEIDRARRLYEERVPVSIGDRATLFQQELVQTLAEGDPNLLGASA